MIDSSGNIVVEYRYDAFGNITYKTSSNLADANPYRYRGYRYDEETKLYYLQSRYYNPETGRFINADGMLKSSNTVLGHNMFAYVSNNPINKDDPTGYYECWANGIINEAEGDPCYRHAYGGTNNSSQGDLVLVLDLSVVTGVKEGYSVVINFSDKYVEMYHHVGVAGGVGTGPGGSIGFAENVDDPGDFGGHFIYTEGTMGIGGDYSVDPTKPSDEAAKATYLTIGAPTYEQGYDYYFKMPIEFHWNENFTGFIWNNDTED